MAIATEQTTVGGVRVLRYDAKAEPLTQRTDVSEALAAHVEKTLGPIAGVIAEVIPGSIPMDVLVVRPNAQRVCWTFVTSGASAYAMPTPSGVDPGEWGRAEYLLSLPTDWVATGVDGMPSFTEQNWYPIGWLKRLARAPAQIGAWFAVGHTIPNGDPPEPFSAENRMVGSVLWWAPSEESARFRTESGWVNLYSVLGLYDKEMHFALDHGSDALMEKLEQVAGFDVFRPNRAPVFGD